MIASLEEYKGITFLGSTSLKYLSLSKFMSNKITCAFEVEKSTSIYSGILRLTDLYYSFPNNLPSLYLIIPDKREKEVILQLQRPSIKNSDIEIHYILFSDLRKDCDAICKFGEDKDILKKISKVVN